MVHAAWPAMMFIGFSNSNTGFHKTLENHENFNGLDPIEKLIDTSQLGVCTGWVRIKIPILSVEVNFWKNLTTLKF